MPDIKLIILITAAVVVGGDVLFGFIRKLKKTLLRLITLLVSACGALMLTKYLGAMLGKYLLPYVLPLLNEDVVALLSRPEMTEATNALCEMIAAPVLFAAAYFVLKFVTWILYFILSFLFSGESSILSGRLMGALCGALCGAVTFAVILVPTFGYATLVSDVIEQASVETQEMEQPVELLDQALETPGAKQAYQLVGSRVFAYLTTAQFGEGEITLAEETQAITTVVRDLSSLSDLSVENLSEEEVQALQAVARDIGDSKLLSTVLSSLMAQVSESWLRGEVAFGMEKPDMGEEVQGIVDAFFLVFSSSDSATVTQDLGTFADCFAILVESDILSMEASDEEFVNKLVSDGVVTDLYGVLNANPRMAPVVTAIRDTGVRVMMSQLGMPEDLRESHGEMLEDMADTLKETVKDDGTIDQEALSTGIQDVMTEHDIPVSEEVSQLVAEAIAENLTAEEISTLTVEEIAEKLIERFTASGQTIQIPEMMG